MKDKRRKAFLQDVEFTDYPSMEDAADAVGGKCILCGKPAFAVATFFPNDVFAKKFGLRRGVIYCVCRDHYNLESVPAIEEKLERDLAQKYN